MSPRALGLGLAALVACAGAPRHRPAPAPLPTAWSPPPALAARDPAVRDAAAAAQRARWRPPPRATWRPLLATVRVGEPVAALEARLPAGWRRGPRSADGIAEYRAYRLDPRWLLQCGLVASDRTVFGCELLEDLEEVRVAPPAGFTGVWTTYYASGQRAREVRYDAEGRPVARTDYAADGSVVPARP